MVPRRARTREEGGVLGDEPGEGLVPRWRECPHLRLPAFGVEGFRDESVSREGENGSSRGLKWLKSRPESGLGWLICAERAD